MIKKVIMGIAIVLSFTAQAEVIVISECNSAPVAIETRNGALWCAD